MTEENFNELVDYDINNAKSFLLENYTTYARVYKVYDGDTISILFKYKDEFIKDSCRLYGIDTPEVSRVTDEEKELGYQARDYLKTLILDKIVKVEFLDLDKYGRPLINIYSMEDGTDIIDLLITNNYGREYYGGKKLDWIV